MARPKINRILSFAQYAKQEFNCNPDTAKGRSKFLKAYECELDIVVNKYPNTSLNILEEGIIEDIAYSAYYDYLRSKGVYVPYGFDGEKYEYMDIYNNGKIL